MFLLDVQPCEYRDPWLKSLDDRIQELCSRPVRVAYFYDELDNSTFRYRVYNMIQVLQNHTTDVSAAWFCSQDRAEFMRVVGLTDVLVICRTRYSHHINALINLAKRAGVLVVFDIDDFVFNTDYVHLLVHTLDQDLANPGIWDHWYAYVSRMGATLRLCDRAIVTNPFLAEQVRRFAPDMDVRVVPNFLNAEQIEMSQKVRESKLRSGSRRDDKIHVGYFSGSPTHNKDFDIASDSLARLLEGDQRLVVRLVGFLEPRGRLLNFLDRIERQPLHDFVNLQRLIGSTEINVVPLQDNVFTNCKSELKYFEAAIAGSVTVASPTYVFADAIADGVNGYLARSYEWQDKVQEAMRLLDEDEAGWAALTQAAYDDALARYAWSVQETAVRTALFGSDVEAGMSDASARRDRDAVENGLRVPQRPLS